MTETRTQFTCVSYDNTDFLIPSDYVVSGFYIDEDKQNAKSVAYNGQDILHFNISKIMEEKFCCNSTSESCNALIFSQKDWSQNVFPQNECIAISFKAEVRGVFMNVSQFSLFCGAMKSSMSKNGISAIHFENKRKKFLIAPDLLMRKFLEEGLL